MVPAISISPEPIGKSENGKSFTLFIKKQTCEMLCKYIKVI